MQPIKKGEKNLAIAHSITTPKENKMTDKLVKEAPFQPGYEDAVQKPTTKTPHLFVATPMYGGMCNGQYTLGMIQMVATFTQARVPFQYAYMMNESLITRARNSLAYDFLASDCTHMMFIDADIGFNPSDILAMINANKDIICGIYPKKEIDWVQVNRAVKAGVPPQELHKHTGAFVVNLVNDATKAEGRTDEAIQIANGGTGFMLIQRKVFEGLLGKVPTYMNDMFLAVDQERKPKVIHEFFATSIDATSGNRLLSEDYHFCKIARDQGYTVWAAPWANLVHCGAYNFSGQLPKA